MTDDNIKKPTTLFIAFMQHRLLFVLLVIDILLALSFIIFALTQINASDVFVWARYTGFGPTNFYRERWLNLYSWPIFVVLTGALHIFLAFQNFKRNQLRLANFLLLSMLFVLLVAFVIFGRIIALPK